MNSNGNGKTNGLHAEWPLVAPFVPGVSNAEAERINVISVELPSKAVADFYTETAGVVVGGFQRPLDPNRARAIGVLMGGDKAKNIKPVPNMHGGILAYADEDEIEIKTQGGRRVTILKPLRIIDGQHRAAGATWAAEHGEAADYTESVRIVTGASHAEVVTWYLRANVESRKVSPDNIIQNAAGMSGTSYGRKSWVARHTVGLATEEPFLTTVGWPLVKFGRDPYGKITAQSIYRAVDIMLPERLNKEGAAEPEAYQYGHRVLNFYASLFPDWGALNDSEKAFQTQDAYSFTMLVAFSRLWVMASDSADGDIEKAEGLVREAFDKAELFKGLPPNIGSGERAAVAVAAFAAGAGGITLDGGAVT